jgi:hypothetical protein
MSAPMTKAQKAAAKVFAKKTAAQGAGPATVEAAPAEMPAATGSPRSSDLSVCVEPLCAATAELNASTTVPVAATVADLFAPGANVVLDQQQRQVDVPVCARCTSCFDADLHYPRLCLGTFC